MAGGGAADENTTTDVPTGELAAEIIADLNEYWSGVDAELGFEYEPVPTQRVTTGADGVLCDGVEVEPEVLDDNAFVDSACREGLLVAYDPDYLARSPARAEATLSHEWGHVIQAQAEQIDLGADPDGLPIDAELQADCLAGAWAASRASVEIDSLRQDIAEAGDPSDVEVDDPDAHGTAEERTTAFDVGFERGPGACVDELIDALPG